MSKNSPVQGVSGPYMPKPAMSRVCQDSNVLKLVMFSACQAKICPKVAQFGEILNLVLSKASQDPSSMVKIKVLVAQCRVCQYCNCLKLVLPKSFQFIS